MFYLIVLARQLDMGITEASMIELPTTGTCKCSLIYQLLYVDNMLVDGRNISKFSFNVVTSIKQKFRSKKEEFGHKDVLGCKET